MRDFLGQEIKVGDFIAYPTRFSSSMWMNLAFVTKVDGNKASIKKVTSKYRYPYGYKDEVISTTFYSPDRALVVRDVSEYGKKEELDLLLQEYDKLFKE